ncbi:MAG TPA: trypsin-like serine protease [Candidatus Limnocylindria bacterium]|jgi:hypothetical protein
MRLRTPIRVAAMAATLTVALATPALAITFGQLDTENRFPNVGALIGEVDGEKFIFCSGTLIEDGDGGWSNLYLTASHCVDDGQQMWVSFDAAIDPEAPETASLRPGIAHAHPDFACCGANDTFDIAVVVLDDEVTGITPAPVAAEGLLDSMSKATLRAATFVAVGYGTVREDKTGGFKPFFFDGQRRWVEQTIMNFNSAWLNLSMQPSTGDGGTCYGDSGGPHFLNGVVVSVTVTGDIPCRATDKTYRVDSPVSQAFLSGFITP